MLTLVASPPDNCPGYLYAFSLSSTKSKSVFVLASISSGRLPNTSNAKAIFSEVFLFSSNCGSCVTIPIFLLSKGIFHLGNFETSIFATSISPFVAIYSLYNNFKNDDFPLPECPTK